MLKCTQEAGHLRLKITFGCRLHHTANTCVLFDAIDAPQKDFLEQFLDEGGWYNRCTTAHLTGLHTKKRGAFVKNEQIFYYYGGKQRYDSLDKDDKNRYLSWREAQMMLVPTGEFFLQSCARPFCEICHQKQL